MAATKRKNGNTDRRKKSSSSDRTSQKKSASASGKKSGSPPSRNRNASQSRKRNSFSSRKQDSRKPAAKGKTKPRSVTTATRETSSEIRLNKFLAYAGIAARRKADEYIANGEVSVNGKVVTELGIKVHPERDTVSYRGNVITLDSQLVYILLNKPKDCITTVDDERGRTTVMDLIPKQHRVFPVGRLDRNTTGLLLLTNDGDLSYALTHPKFGVEKVYIANIDKKISSPDVDKLKRGIRLEDGMTAPCEVEILDSPASTMIGLVLREGKNRQVRRMFEALGYAVKKLERVRYAGLSLDQVKRGTWRYLDEHEVKHLKKLTKNFAEE